MSAPSVAPRRLPDSTEGTVLVQLDSSEVVMCELLAALRHSHHLLRANGQALGGSFNGRDEDVHGLIGEYAVGKALNRWVPFVVKDPWVSTVADVGKIYQVRATTHRKGHLIVQKKDPDDQVYVLARLWRQDDRGVQVRVGGWIWGAEAKQDRWWATHIRSSAYMVPAHELGPIHTIPED